MLSSVLSQPLCLLCFPLRWSFNNIMQIQQSNWRIYYRIPLGSLKRHFRLCLCPASYLSLGGGLQSPLLWSKKSCAYHSSLYTAQKGAWISVSHRTFTAFRLYFYYKLFSFYCPHLAWHRRKSNRLGDLSGSREVEDTRWHPFPPQALHQKYVST